MTDIIIQGIGGRMGHVLCEMIAQREDCRVVAGIDMKDGEMNGIPVYDSLDKLDGKGNVVIDFSAPAAVEKALPYCEAHKLPIVVCTTGLSEELQLKLVQLSRSIPVFKSANMSMGINVLSELCKRASAILGANYDIEIVEQHHHNKLDAPSGTALMLADAINEENDGAYHYVYDRSAVRQKRDPKEIGISAVRGGSIVTLFFFLSLLEDTGYMARVAFVMDKLLRRIGLSGRSIVPMLIGFGCTVPGVMASRTLPSERDRKMTILLTPFMSCSAKLPIYSLFAAAFFPEHAALVMVSLYFLGIAVGILMAILLKSSVFKGEAVPFVMELPNYRLPGLKNVVQLLWEKARDFLQRAFTVIFVATIIIWFLQSFDLRLSLTADPQQSILAWLASGIAPLFAPLGFADWRVSTALITGFMAKESVVSTLTILYGSSAAFAAALSPAAAAPLLVFCLLYTPCIAAVASVKRELGGKWAFIMVANQCIVAWLAAFGTRLIMML